MDTYGFVYIWMDKKHKRFYIGSHWGHEDDGYVCSSKWMKNAYKRRPLDFKRRILKTGVERSKLIVEEQKWLDLIPIESVKTKYYNLNTRAIKHWHTSDTSTMSVKQKISEKMKAKHQDPEYQAIYMSVKQKISEKMKAKHQDPEYQAIYMAGRQRLPAQTAETREKRRISLLGKNTGKDNSKARAAARLANIGKSISEDHREKIKAAGHFKSLNTMKRTCSRCGLEANPGTIGRYHNEKCKKRMI